MRILRTIIAVIVSVVGFYYAFVAFIFIGWGWSDSLGGWTPLQWVLILIPWSLPLLFSMWIVYRCCGSSFKRTLITEAAGLAIIILVESAYLFHLREFPVLVEQKPPLLESRDSGRRPSLPLVDPAVGIEGTDGKFIPMLLLSWPPPGWGFQDLTFDLKTSAPEIKVFRGTNETASANFFLGKFQIIGYSKSKQALNVMLFFQLSDKRQLFLIAHESGSKTHLKLQRIDEAPNP